VLGHAAFAVLTSLAVAMVALNVFAWSGSFVDSDASLERSAAHQAAHPTTAPGAATLIERREQPAPATLVVTASRGPCWLSVRRDSSTGKRLYLGILRRGRSLHVSGARIWMRVGAGENLVVRVNGRKLADFPEGIADVAVTSDGVSRI
jgi:Domain of unknown function (DUF4115)